MVFFDISSAFLFKICLAGLTLLTGTMFQLNSKPGAGSNPIVTTTYGDVEGIMQLSRDNRPFASFRGIPYAKPPVGPLRFKPTEPPEKWSHVWNAKEDGPMCIQKNFLFGENPPVTGVEDCLYINVYSPNDFKSPGAEKYPVMAVIHYGGFLCCTAQSVFLGPEYFMDENVVLVSFNYRVGVLGFLSTEDDAAPGNFGFKDQVAALEWIQENVGAFGGDKNRVTIFGESTGGASVHYHMLSESSKNLFHAAISESGSAVAPWSTGERKYHKDTALQQAKFVNCDQAGDSFAIIECLRKVDAGELVEISLQFKYFSIEPFLTYFPVEEKRSALNPKPFVTKNTMQILKSGKFNKVPWLTGITKDEGILRAASLIRQSKTLKEMNENFDSYVPRMIFIDEEKPTTWKNIKDFYLKGQSYVNASDPTSVQGFIDLYTDRWFTYPMYQSILLHYSNHDNPPIWVYNFAYRGDLTYGELMAATNETIDFKWGVSHVDELLYLFTTPAAFPPLKYPDDVLSTAMIKMWTNFATYGNPTSRAIKCKNEDISWSPTLKPTQRNHKIKLNFLEITGPYVTGCPFKMEMKDDLYSQRINFWKMQSLLQNQLLST